MGIPLHGESYAFIEQALRANKKSLHLSGGIFGIKTATYSQLNSNTVGTK